MSTRQANWYGSSWIRKEKRLAIYMRDDWACVYCQKDLSRVKPRLRTLDHVIPVIYGGTNNANNLVTCCKACNDRKGARDFDQFAAKAGVMERLCDQLEKPINVALAKQILAGTIDMHSIKRQRKEVTR